jgi:hypothetical protein
VAEQSVLLFATNGSSIAEDFAELKHKFSTTGDRPWPGIRADCLDFGAFTERRRIPVGEIENFGRMTL